ncbi:MAG: Lrp/AsnC family transcriptional regulator [Chloroflexota bacterium]
MDDLNFAILTHLQVDGRKPFTEIAKALDVSEGTVRNRVAKMTADKTLQIIGLIDPHQAGFECPALIYVSVEPQLTEAAIEEISTFPEVSYLLSIAGDFDLLVEVMCRNRDNLSDFVTHRLRKVTGVQDTQTTFILKTHKVVQPDLNLIKSMAMQK